MLIGGIILSVLEKPDTAVLSPKTNPANRAQSSYADALPAERTGADEGSAGLALAQVWHAETVSVRYGGK